jgi:N-acetylglutamate synthase-like GNAT family acetyltransferase
MLLRNACPEDFPAIRDLAGRLNLAYEGMERDLFWVAEDETRIIGHVGLKRHSDSDELVGLGVDPDRRSAGLGGRLIEALWAETSGDVYLATVIPGFFERYGFRPTVAGPAGMAKDPAWCEGCPRERCTIMIRGRR